MSRLDTPDLHVSVTIYGFEMDSINNTYALHYLLDGEDTVHARIRIYISMVTARRIHDE